MPQAEAAAPPPGEASADGGCGGCCLLFWWCGECRRTPGLLGGGWAGRLALEKNLENYKNASVCYLNETFYSLVKRQKNIHLQYHVHINMCMYNTLIVLNLCKSVI